MSLHSSLKSALEFNSSHPAISVPGDEYCVTFAGLLAKSLDWGAIFQEFSDRIPLLHMDKSPYLYEIIVTFLLEGRAYCPLDISVPVARVIEIGQQFQRAVIISSQPDLFPVDYPRIPLNLERTLFALLLPSVESNPPHHNAAYHISTSGSTGSPKIVVVPHDNILPYCSWLAENEGVSPSTRWAQFSGSGFDLFIEDIVTCLLGGGELIVLNRPADRASPGQFIERHRITYWNSVPSVIPLLLRNNPDLTSVKSFHFVGEPLPRQHAALLQSRAPLSRIINKYCPTESALYCCQHFVQPNDLDESAPTSIPIGAPVPGASFIFLDDGEYLRCVIISNRIARGYHGLQSRVFGDILLDNFHAFFYDTGDFFFRHNGNFYFSHRRDGMVKIRGNRVDKGDLANAAVACGLLDAVVVHVDDKLFLVHESGSLSMEEREFFSLLRQRLPPYALPSKILSVSSFPRTHSGKIDHNMLMDVARGALTIETPHE